MMSSLGSDSLNRLLVAAQRGDARAREEIAQWMVEQVQAKTASVLRNEGRNMTARNKDAVQDSQPHASSNSHRSKDSVSPRSSNPQSTQPSPESKDSSMRNSSHTSHPSHLSRTNFQDSPSARHSTRNGGSFAANRSEGFDYVGRDFEQQVIRHSSLANDVLLKLIQGKTIDRANHLGYLRMAIVRATKNVLIDIYRHRAARKRAMGHESPPDYPWLRQFEEENWDLLELNRALEELDQIDPRKASVITMRFFMQMTMQEIADSLGVSITTVEADWSFSRAWLKKRLE